MQPKGTLIAIGGNEKKEFEAVDEKFQADFGEAFILPYILNKAEGMESHIEVITTASDVPKMVKQTYQKTLKTLGAENLGFCDIRDRKEAEEEKTLKRLKKASLIIFSGGDQSQISRHIRNTKVHDLICDRYLNDDVIIAGTSAGAMAMSEEMIAGGRPKNVFTKNTVKMDKGLGLIKEMIFDSHFIRRHRFGRVAEAVANFPDKLGIGLGEDTALVIKNGNDCEIIGSGMAIFFDGSNLSHNKYPELKNDVALSLTNLVVHVLAPNDKYFIKEKKAEIYYDPEHHK